MQLILQKNRRSLPGNDCCKKRPGQIRLGCCVFNICPCAYVFSLFLVLVCVAVVYYALGIGNGFWVLAWLVLFKLFVILYQCIFWHLDILWAVFIVIWSVDLFCHRHFKEAGRSLCSSVTAIHLWNFWWLLWPRKTDLLMLLKFRTCHLSIDFVLVNIMDNHRIIICHIFIWICGRRVVFLYSTCAEQKGLRLIIECLFLVDHTFVLLWSNAPYPISRSMSMSILMWFLLLHLFYFLVLAYNIINVIIILKMRFFLLEWFILWHLMTWTL